MRSTCWPKGLVPKLSTNCLHPLPAEKPVREGGRDVDAEGFELQGDKSREFNKNETVPSLNLIQSRCLQEQQFHQQGGLVVSSKAPKSNIQKKGIYKRRNGRRVKEDKAFSHDGSRERKRQFPDDIEMDTSTLKKVKWVGLSVFADNLSEMEEGEMMDFNVKVGFPGQSLPAK